MPFIMIKYYVIPFQRAHDMLMPDGSINWATGEAVVALSWAVVWIGLGLLARHTIKKHYSPAKA